MIPEKILAQKLARRLNSTMEEQEVYEYGLAAIISTVMTTAVLLLIGLITQRLLETILYILVFVILRSQCGGYHAPTRVVCIVVSAVGLLLVLYIFSYFKRWDVILAISLLGMAILSPIDSPNKPIQKSKRRGFKIRSIIIAIVFSCIAIFWTEMRVIIASTIMWVVLLMICQAIFKRKIN